MSKINIGAIIFDLDGTLVDSGKDLAISVNHTLKYFDLHLLNEDLIISYIGDGLETLLDKSFFESAGSKSFFNNENNKIKSLEVFREYYYEHLLDNTYCYPRVIETLKNLKDNNKKLAVVTNKPQEPTQKILKNLHLSEFFDIILGGDSVKNKKPNPEPINIVLDSFSIEPQKTVIVGDNHTDIEAGKSANIYSCFVNYGIGNLNDSKADFIIDDIYEICDVVC